MSSKFSIILQMIIICNIKISAVDGDVLQIFNCPPKNENLYNEKSSAVDANVLQIQNGLQLLNICNEKFRWSTLIYFKFKMFLHIQSIKKSRWLIRIPRFLCSLGRCAGPAIRALGGNVNRKTAHH